MFNGMVMSERKEQILLYLLSVRAATVKQMVVGIFGTNMSDKEYRAKKSVCYKILKEFKNRSLVHEGLLKDKIERFFYLSPRGLEDIYEYLGIYEGYEGKGFNNDIGYFPYDLYNPPRKQLTHFLLQTDISNTMENMKRVCPGIFDYRDNRYAANRYEVLVTTTGIDRGIFRPDGELKIRDDIYLVEADTGSERGRNLNEKFAGYARYFKFLEQNNLPLPKGAIFITPTKFIKNPKLFNLKKAQRFNSLVSAFESEAKEYSYHFSINYLEAHDLEERLLHLQMPTNTKLSIAMQVKNLLKASTMTNISSHVPKHKEDEGIVYLTPEISDAKALYLICDAEGCESSIWVKAYQTYIEKRQEYDEIKLFFYYKNSHTIPAAPVHLSEIKSIRKKEFFEKSYILDISGSVPIWFTMKHELLTESPI